MNVKTYENTQAYKDIEAIVKGVMGGLLLEHNRSALLEELSIADSVKAVAVEIKKRIMAAGLSGGVVDKEIKIGNVDFIGGMTIQYSCTDFKSQDEFNAARKRAYSYVEPLEGQKYTIVKNTTSDITLLKNAFLFVKFYSIKGIPDVNTFDDALYHEVEHLYQIYQRISKGYTGQPKSFDQNLYNFSTQNINHQNDIIAALSFSIYYKTPMEQDAFANGLYGYIMGLNPKTEMEVDKFYKQSRIFRTLQKFLNVQSYLPSISEASKEYAEAAEVFTSLNFKFSKKQAIKMVDRAIVRLREKVNNVLKKVRIDSGFQANHRNPPPELRRDFKG